MARKRKSIRSPQGTLTPISKSRWNKATRNRRCVVIGGDEGGSTWQCGKQVLVSDHVNDRYYKMTGKGALYTGYQLRRRTVGITKPHQFPRIKTRRKKQRRSR